MKEAAMLDPLKIMQEIKRALPDLYAELSDEHIRATQLFSWLRSHPDIVEQLKVLPGPQPVPLWEGPLDAVVPVVQQAYPYSVVATDGSQIYPDKHQGVPCYVLNSGTVHFVYGVGPAQVKLESSPVIVTQQDDANISEDVVNCRRAELEFEVGLAASQEAMKQYPEVPFAFLCDGSLIYWHLESKSPAIKERFLKRYIALQDEFYKARVPIAGYISLPKSKELIALLRNCLALKLAPIEGLADSLLNSVDTDVVALFLKPFERTTLFTHNSALAKQYPPHLVPCFVYLHTENEIARVEIPRWVAQDNTLLNTMLQIILDQAAKGNGYPIVLAESHEQAVIKGHEREFFFSLLRKMNLSQNHSMPSSQKSLKKRFVSV